MTGKERQTVADMTIEATGDIENLFAVAEACGADVNGAADGLEADTDAMPSSEKVLKHYSSERLSPATLPEEEYADVLTDDGGTETITDNNEEPITYEI